MMQFVTTGEAFTASSPFAIALREELRRRCPRTEQHYKHGTLVARSGGRGAPRDSASTSRAALRQVNPLVSARRAALRRLWLNRALARLADLLGV